MNKVKKVEDEKTENVTTVYNRVRCSEEIVEIDC